MRLTLLLALFFAANLSAQVRRDMFVPLSDGDSLDATSYAPAVVPPAGAPAILFVHGYGLSKDVDTANCRVYAAAGYLTFCYSVRGHGNSSGLSMIMSVRERTDLAEVIAYLRRMPEADSARTAVVGGSQGGLHGLWAAADSLPVRAVSSDVIVPHWASDMLMNGSVRRTMLLLLQSGAVRYGAVRDSLWDLLRADDFDAFRSMFVPARDLDTARLNASLVPTLRLLKWQDHYFSAQDGIASFARSAAQKKIYLGTRGHFSDAAESERIYQYDQVTRWLDHFLRGADNGITEEPVVTFASSSLPMDSAGSFTWTRTGTSSWPPPGVQPYRFYFRSDSTLGYEPPGAAPDSLFLENLYTDTSYTFEEGYIEGFRGSYFDTKIPRRSLAFESAPLPTELYWIGSPSMTLYVRGTSGKYPLHAQIYEVDSLGTRFFVNRVNFTARGRAPGAEDTVTAAGIAHAHRFTAGSRIRVELTNIDVTNRMVLGSYPFVVPLFANAGVSIRMDAGRPSSIELPLIGAPTAVAAGDPPVPSRLSLSQNYPNPFNGTTVIRFSINAPAGARLEIFDLLGRRVETPLDEILLAGDYAVSWRADDRPSGVYYYRLTAGSAQKTGKMLLLR